MVARARLVGVADGSAQSGGGAMGGFSGLAAFLQLASCQTSMEITGGAGADRRKGGILSG